MRSAELPALRVGRTPEPPYYAVIFTSKRTAGDQGYGKMSDRMVELAQQQPGFLGVDSARSEDGIGITVAYWKDEASIKAWKQNLEHLEAKGPVRCTGRADRDGCPGLPREAGAKLGRGPAYLD